MKNYNCDGGRCVRDRGQIRVLPTGGDANALLCHACFNHEMAWRRERIKEGIPYELPKWEELKVYES
jgi:hypothetical protein